MLSLPYYKFGTKEYVKIHSNIHRARKKYGFKTNVINRRFLDMQRGNKYCKKCETVKRISEFRYIISSPEFMTTCKTCEDRGFRVYSNDIKTKIYQKEYRDNKRQKVLTMIQNEMKCVRCGCDDWRLLEINHINGGGGLENRLNNTKCITDRIWRGDRGVDDLELLCKPCNSIHYLELKWGKLPMKVVWK